MAHPTYPETPSGNWVNGVVCAVMSTPADLSADMNIASAPSIKAKLIHGRCADHTGGADVRGADRSAQRRAGQYHRRGAALADEPIQRGHPVDAATDRANDFPAAKGGSDGQRSRSHQTR